MELQPTNIYPDMDPRLQVAADRHGRGLGLRATTASEPEEISVVALVERPGQVGEPPERQAGGGHSARPSAARS